MKTCCSNCLDVDQSLRIISLTQETYIKLGKGGKLYFHNAKDVHLKKLLKI